MADYMQIIAGNDEAHGYKVNAFEYVAICYYQLQITLK